MNCYEFHRALLDAQYVQEQRKKAMEKWQKT